ncbi:MAG: hypothetical protein DRH23_04815 [Deltaproteobacteria bacterium]|nr:hypothetical protein [Deltaproteobacteria bacterium]MBW2188007.1 hypothetical protein [Deltaproteobacteria bacterium]MBW2546047.1 hypothetical protein [Deltaproteobacteria bacterium]MBW2717139.1 hypothetical protein [Deltaproteobacteria bacterium]RLB50250.1 MAG: hypothetical protein DRH23_04815 [Deltaproteobacteria bacterium]
MKMSRLMWVLLPVLALSCAETGGPVSVNAEWNLTCPADSPVGCPGAPANTCLGDGGHRAILGEHRQLACTGDPIRAICEAVQGADGTRLVTLEANIADDFAFELHAETIEAGDGLVEQTDCYVTIIEEGTSYGGRTLGRCGEDDISMDQPCQLSGISVQGSDVSFELACESLINGTSVLAYDVGAVGVGPTTITFANCVGF